MRQPFAEVRASEPVARTRMVDSRAKTAYLNPNSFNRQRFEPTRRRVDSAPSQEAFIDI
jgi:hypothetical protein